MALATQTQIRRGTASELAAAVPVVGEPGMDTTNKRLIIGDGTTFGGIPHLNVFDALSTKFNYATAGGTADALTITLPFAPIAYAQPLSIRFKASATNTGSVTVNVNALGTKNIYKLAEGAIVPLEAGDLVNGAFYEAIYDGTQFLLFGFAPKASTSFELMEDILLVGNQATIDFDQNFDSSDLSYFMKINIATFSTGTPDLNIRTSDDGGVTYKSANGSYDWTKTEVVGTTASNTQGSGASGSLIHLGDAVPTGVSGFFHMSKEARAPVNGLLGNVGYRCEFAGRSLALGGPVNAIRLLLSTGSFTAGTRITLYKMK